MEKQIKNLLNKMPYIKTLKKEVDAYKTLYPPGHFYSPIPSKEEVKRREEQIFSVKEKEIEGINLNESQQLQLLEELKKYYKEIPFKHEQTQDLRYYFNNNMFSYADACILFCMVRNYNPNKVIEIGSGFSSALMLDTNEKFMDNKIKFNFIDPYPERLLKLLSERDKNNNLVISKEIQDIDLKIFEELKENDILFVDSSHVIKAGGDVNYILFKILPRLNGNVIIHFHDIFYPFEYPKEWILKERAWNECYMLRAFLQFNPNFKILLFNTFLKYYYEEWFKDNMPLFLNKSNIPGSMIKECSSLWIIKQG